MKRATLRGKERNLKIMTLNTLFVPFDPIRKLIQRPITRYRHQLGTLIPELAPDIVWLQEVNPTYLEILEEYDEYYTSVPHSEYKEDNKYYIFHGDLRYSGRHFTAILSKIPLVELIDLSRDKYAFFKWGSINMIIINIHLPAFDFKLDKRSEELFSIYEKFFTLPILHGEKSELGLSIKNAQDNNNVILTGDFNYIFPGEHDTLKDIEFHDLWLQKHSHSSGCTWDTHKNTLLHISELFDNSRVRLDLITSRKSKEYDWVDIGLCANSEIGKFLYPSDHFGIIWELKQTAYGLTTSHNAFKEEFENLEKFELPSRKFIVYLSYRILLILAILGMIIYLTLPTLQSLISLVYE